MKRMIARMAVATAAVVAVTAGVFARPAATPKAHADPANVLLMNLGICLAGIPDVTSLPLSSVTGCAVSNLQYSAGAAGGDTDLTNIANLLGNGNDVIEPEDFAGPVDFTGNQIQQREGSNSLSHLAVIAFVHSVAPVTFHTSAGIFAESSSSTWLCNGAGSNPDSDCGGPESTSTTFPTRPDHVVVANLTCSVSSCPTRGEANLTVEQDGVIFPITFTVVGDPREVQFFTLETAIQAGMPDDPTTGDPSCPFSASLAAVTKALGEAEKTVIVARALDIDGTAVSGAWMNMSVDDKTEGVLALSEAPTLNLGGFGFGAPTILCAPIDAKTGTVTVKAQLERTGPFGLPVNLGADFGNSGPLAYNTVTFNVGAAPADVTLTADPAEIACDGSATSTVSAAIVDAAGNPALSGTAVKFDVQVLGTANPINTTTNDKGIATTAVTPLAGDAKGVPVTVYVYVGEQTTPTIAKQILVNCAQAAPAAPGGETGGGTTPPGGSSGGGTSGVITGPNTGSGGPAAAGTLSWWPTLCLLAGAIALGAMRLAQVTVVRRRS